MFAIGLAGSVFFSLDFSAARWRVALYLVLTIAPFAVAAPLIGPAIDRVRGGRRWIIMGSMAVRVVLAVLVVRHMDNLWFYPAAFGMLIVQKVYAISKSAIVPGTVHSDAELVTANSRLTQLSAVAVVIAAIPGGILLRFGGGEWSVALGGIVFFIGTVLSFQLPATTVATQPADEAELEELRSAGIVHAASAMGLIRGIVGFLAFMLAFDFKNSGAPLWQLGFVAAAAQVGFFFGALSAPRVRRSVVEERILIGALAIMIAGGALTALIGGLVGAAILSMLVGATGSAAKQSFDSIVQRDAPDANRGRSFARFETRFQLVWVIGALIPIVLPIPARLGFALIALVAGFAFGSYLISLRNLRNGRLPPPRRIRRRRSEAATGATPSTDDGTTTTASAALADLERAETLGFSTDPEPSGVVPTPPVTPALPSATHDGRRRWMRPPGHGGAAVQVDRHGQGLLFDPAAWTDGEEGEPEGEDGSSSGTTADQSGSRAE